MIDSYIIGKFDQEEIKLLDEKLKASPLVEVRHKSIDENLKLIFKKGTDKVVGYVSDRTLGVFNA